MNNSEQLDKGIIGCCSTGIRHEVCSHVKTYINQQIVSELEKLEQLPNVYPEKIRGQYTHVEAIYTSAITDRIKQLKLDIKMNDE